MPATHRIAATPETVRWGAFDAGFAPLLEIPSGDLVVLECVSGAPEVMPAPETGLKVPPALAAIHAARPPRLGPHILTGPVAVTGAEPGDVLRIDIEKIELGWDWGFCGFRPLFGTLPEDFPYARMLHIPVDRAARTGHVPVGPGVTLPLSPFFGVMGVAPPSEWGAISTKEPRAHGGNLDNKELTEGSTLWLPVHVPGGNFSAGDGHGVQGDGEVCINALEMCLTGHFRLTLEKGGGAKDPALRYPRAETATHYISMGMHEDLDLAMKQALREMIGFIVARMNVSPADAYQLCSLAVDFHVTQTVNGEKGVHGMLRKGLFF
ncbi:acetamidase/formamidase family protein [Falsiroseomonas selenitidurans]|uniref:Acetamidase/formamidase family protein n=1 Tax=Falsiroseomonas selenitidurans TaxID=2716335 RepID=A0ABX1E937_9PROT|nr:acetamidase/formamidase family protein [Falsiroseomonas selenitidurans]NKC31420.1 acetamidase/formamidase family protein [Falsiroseomonas selenitidurans]